MISLAIQTAVRRGWRPGSLIRLITLIVGLPVAVSGQVVAGAVTDADTGAPVRGALVVLIDDTGERQARVLTDRAGRYEVRPQDPGTFRLRVEMVGYRTHTTPPFTVRRGQRVERPIAVGFEPITLDGIAVRTDRRRCEVRSPEQAAAVVAVWAQAERALVAARVTEESRPYRYRSVRFERRLEPESLDIIEESTDVRSHYGTTPYRSLSPEEAARSGFVSETGDEVVFHAPDVRILLSDQFLETHCLSVVASDDDPRLIGLAFEPVGGRRVPEIRGTLWLHRRSAALRFLEFGYVNVQLRLPMQWLGGRLDFARLPHGGWIVSSYWIRTPYMGLHQFPYGGEVRERQVVTAVREQGGRVLDIIDPIGEPTGWMEQGALQGVVWDSAVGGPLRGATVTVLGTGRRALTDAAGRFHVPGIPPGEHLVTFRHGRRDELAYDPPPTRVTIEPRAVHDIELGLPADLKLPVASLGVGLGLEVTTEHGRVLPAHVGSWLTGRIEDASTGESVAGMEVRIGSNAALSDSTGWFRVTGLRSGEHQIELRHIAYGDVTATLRLTAFRETVARFRVSPRPVAVGEVVVSTRSEEVGAEVGSGVAVSILGRSELDQLEGRGARVGDVAGRIPGLDVVYGRFYGPGHEDARRFVACITTNRPFPTIRSGGGRAPWCEMVEVYLDDVRVQAAGELLAHADLSQFQRIEYVPALGAARWGLRASETGVLLLWTRRR